ncbi:MCE family protein [Scytonema hofmannii FACHB-248]|uniref:MCE family protein n=1 Tax=Scytonema hofmannii FACHB-248 TaxID=1842502 RepID=A0ABR8GTY6_9CYAN|nr:MULTISPECIES: MlaD family protein [Nostocales]MBD2606941.1 MCE family protein [Scytonema hofmannii FACHB-248]
MRSRTFREGSVGLLLLAGLGVFGLILLWLNRVTTSQRSYKVIIEFANATGMQKGTLVRYRGVKVGSISKIQPGLNNVEVEVDISQPELKIPRDVKVEANQSGLISESIIDITPKATLIQATDLAKPTEKNCNPQIIVCNGSRLKGEVGISVDELIRSSTQLSVAYSNPKFYTTVNKTLESTSQAAANIAALSRELQVLSKNAQQQLRTFSTTANSVQQATDKLSTSTNQTVIQFGTTAKQFSTTATELGTTATEFGRTAKTISSTANQAKSLVTNLDSLVTTNRSTLVGTLNNLSQASNQLRVTVSSLSPTVNRFTQGKLLENLETLSANAAIASTNLRDATKSFNDPNNRLLLQQTLDSARVTFENTQKITSDLDELTGDPAFRNNLRQLVNGLSTLVSSTEQMQQQVQIADTLDSFKTSVNKSDLVIPAPTATQKVMIINMSPAEEKSAAKKPEITISLSTSTSSQARLLKQLREYKEQQNNLKQSKQEEKTEFKLTVDN